MPLTANLLALVILVFTGKPAEGGCPDGVPVVMCKADPCDVTTCPAYPLAECRSNYCGGCNAEFYVQGVNVNCQECRDGSTPVTCKMHPCATAKPGRGYFCLPNFCGKCSMSFVKLCPDDTRPVECRYDPCATVRCGFNTVCVSSRCGGCTASCQPQAIG